MRRILKKYPLLIIIAATGILFTGISVNGADGIYRDIARHDGYSPALALMFQGIHEKIYPWSDGTATVVADRDLGMAEEPAGDGGDGTLSGGSAPGQSVSGGSVSGGSVSGDSLSGNSQSSQSDSLSGNEGGAAQGGSLAETGESSGISGDEGTGNGESETAGNGGMSGGEGNGTAGNEAAETSGPASGQGEPSSGAAQDSQTAQTEGGGQPAENGGTALAFQQVDEDYFNDALFIGDSRTVGLYEYGKIEDRAQFYARTSLTIYDIIEKKEPIVKTADDRGYITVEQALSENQFGKIYIMIGLNEMGTGTAQSFAQAYENVISRIRELQPQAIIFIQAIMHVGPEKDQTDPIFNNANVEARNQLLAQLADNQNIFYLNINEAVCDETGCLRSDWTFDQIHLKAAYYQQWKDYLLAHGIVRP